MENSSTMGFPPVFRPYPPLEAKCQLQKAAKNTCRVLPVKGFQFPLFDVLCKVGRVSSVSP